MVVVDTGDLSLPIASCRYIKRSAEHISRAFNASLHHLAWVCCWSCKRALLLQVLSGSNLVAKLPVLLGLFRKAAESEGLIDGAWVSRLENLWHSLLYNLLAHCGAYGVDQLATNRHSRQVRRHSGYCQRRHEHRQTYTVSQVHITQSPVQHAEAAPDLACFHSSFYISWWLPTSWMHLSRLP